MYNRYLSIFHHPILLFLLWIIPCQANAEIYSAASVEEINNSLTAFLEKRNTAKTLVLLPLERFLLEPANSAFYTQDKDFQTLIARISKKAKLSQSKYLKAVILTQYEQRFSDPMIPEFIKNLQTKNVPILVTTRNFSGSLNKIPYLEVWTWKYLFDKGIDLSKSPIGSKQIMFSNYEKIGGTYPTLYKGLLSCNSEGGKNSPQSIIGYLLLEKLKWLPDVIYVVDREESYIKSLQEQFKLLRPNLQVVGFVYSPADRDGEQMSQKDFIKFWEEVIAKLNAVTRKESNAAKENPYEQ